MDSSRLEIKIPSEIKAQLEKIASERGVTVSDIVREAIDMYLKLAEYNIPTSLIKQALQKPTESKYLLVLSEWTRQGESFIDEQHFEVLFGEVDEVILEEWDEGYPYRKGRDVLIIPKTIPTIIRVSRYDDTCSPIISSETLYIFTKDGWKSIQIR